MGSRRVLSPVNVEVTIIPDPERVAQAVKPAYHRALTMKLAKKKEGEKLLSSLREEHDDREY
ncbi:MAG: hypothetical protein GXX09_02395, partial [Syntrophomonadaceae bacterium]|nr:hypothetical protein [Syntrophomonadaceae bacterium]